MLAAIELGGTKIICAVGINHKNIKRTLRIKTTNPNENMCEILNFFQLCEKHYGKIHAFGVATFGPVDINTSSQHYGTILHTPKPGWSDFALRKKIQTCFKIPVTVTTDVNGSLLAETTLGAAVGVKDAIYVTIGTGIGAGIMVNGTLVSGFLHPEIGHMRIPTNGVTGICPFHGNCLEGLVSGPAIASRAGMQAEDLGSEDELWDEISLNIADMCVNLTTILAPEKIILGGGVMNNPGLLPRVRRITAERLANYLPIDSRVNGFENFIVAPKLGNDCGLIGAFLLAE